MMWLAALLLALGLALGLHVEICTMSQKKHLAKIFWEFSLSMALMGGAVLLGLWDKGLITPAEAWHFFWWYCLILFFAGLARTAMTHSLRTLEKHIFRDALSDEECQGCAACFMNRLHRLSARAKPGWEFGKQINRDERS